MRFTPLLALSAAVATAHASYMGFNYASTFTDGSAKQQSDFEAEFKAAQSLAGTDGGFTSARLYTGIQAGTANSPISAIPAAISTKTTLLLGLWASAGQTNIDNEITALKSAITKYGSDFTDLIAGISVGSEDLYRNSATGIENDSLPGANPADIVNYIKQVRSAIAGTAASGASVGHVDTWDAWTNSSNSEVVTNCDWLGMDTYPYFQYTQANSIEHSKDLFYAALNATSGVAGGKEVWVTETGWPVSGKQEGAGVASVANAEKYWQETGCSLFGQTNVWWYILDDSLPTTPNPSFGLLSSLSGSPLYDLTCSSSSSSTSSSSSSTSTSSSSSSSSSASSSASSTSSSGTSSTSSSTTKGPSSGSSGVTTTTGGSSSAGSSSTATGASSSTGATGSTGSSSVSSGKTSTVPSVGPSSSSAFVGSASGIKAAGLVAGIGAFAALFL